MSRRRIVTLCCLAAAAGTAAPAGAQQPLPGERIAAGVTAAGTDLSGQTIEEAAATLTSVHGERLERGTITVQAADITWKLSSVDAEARFDVLTSAKRALYAGRVAGGQPTNVPLAVTFDQRAVDSFIARIKKRLKRPAVDSKLKISIRRVRVTHSKRGRDIGDKTLAKQVAAAVADPNIPRVFKPRLISVKPKVTADVLRKSASTVLTIERSSFTLRLFKRLKVVKTYKVAVGLPDYPTPRGLFAIQSKQVNPVWSVPNSPWAGELAGTTVTGGSAANPLKARWMGVSGSVGIHGTGQEYTVGTRASHGCIRMRVNDVIALYKRVPLGTPVLIR
ncbi:MAG TPA: L,D-transpeptidase family protein [Solirubrobacteraceae bacterium]|nr:L,D-transpeptidase family protein [Solirubrobacteraceae bacterium]